MRNVIYGLAGAGLGFGLGAAAWGLQTDLAWVALATGVMGMIVAMARNGGAM